MWIVHQPVVNLLPDLASDIDELRWIALLWCVELGTVTTIITVRGDGELVECRNTGSLGGPLPWVLASIGEDSVGASLSVESELLSCAVNHQGDIEDILAHVFPVSHVEKRRSHGQVGCFWLLWGLEPSELSAVLVSPGAGRTISDLNILEHVSVIVTGGNACNLGLLSHFQQLIIKRHVLNL